jgi:hypothetical protein
MGIENFFTAIKQNTILKSTISNLDINTKINANYIYIDFNSCIYDCKSLIDKELNYLLYEIIHNDTIINPNLTKNICLKYSFNEINFTLENFKQTFSKVSMIYSKYILEYIINHINIYQVDLIKTIYIVFDGIPTMAKIIEQKKRKYQRYIKDIQKQQIFESESKLFDSNRILFEENKISISIPSLDEINKLISSDDFKISLKNLCPNLISYEISFTNENGEGETKMISHINLHKKLGSYTIFSPDSDLIILCMIQQNLFSKIDTNTTFSIVRSVQSTYEIIKIDEFNSNLFKFISSEKNKDYDKFMIIRDISFLLTFFGNDFIPKIASLNMYNGINIICYIYNKYLFQYCYTNKYLLFEDKSQIKISYKNLSLILYELSLNENKLIYETYYAKTYKNFSYINKLFQLDNSLYFVDKIFSYMKNFNQIIKEIIDKKISIDIIVKNILDTNTFSKLFILIEKPPIIPPEIINDEEIITYIITHIRTTIELYGYYKGKLNFIPYSKTINDKFHHEKLKQYLIHPLMKISSYDIESYKFDFKLDEYSEIQIKLKGLNKIYSKNSFYIGYNNVNLNKYDNIISYNNYLEGLFWVTNLYHTNNFNLTHTSIWIYEVIDSIDNLTFTDLYLYLKTLSYNELNEKYFQITNIKSNYFISNKLFLTHHEHHIYITPINNLINSKHISKSELEIILSKSEYFPDLTIIIKDKTYLKYLKNMSYFEFKNIFIYNNASNPAAANGATSGVNNAAQS